MEFLLLKTAHILSIMVLTSCLSAEYILLDDQLTKKQLKHLALIDAIYGASAILVLVTGFYIALNLGKGREFYFDNVSIYVKLGLFILIGVLSILPTIFYLKNNRGDENEVVTVGSKLKKIILAELLILLCIPIFAVSLANGLNFFNL